MRRVINGGGRLLAVVHRNRDVPAVDAVHGVHGVRETQMSASRSLSDGVRSMMGVVYFQGREASLPSFLLEQGARKGDRSGEKKEKKVRLSVFSLLRRWSLDG